MASPALTWPEKTLGCYRIFCAVNCTLSLMFRFSLFLYGLRVSALFAGLFFATADLSAASEDPHDTPAGEVAAHHEGEAHGDDHGGHHYPVFPKPLDSYEEAPEASIGQVLWGRITQNPFNLVATLMFLAAIVHTFLAGRFMEMAHHEEGHHEERLRAKGWFPESGQRMPVSLKARLFHYLGEVEAIFGLWVIPLIIAIAGSQGIDAVKGYIGHTVNFTEPMFVVVIMAIAATRPVLRFAEGIMDFFSRLGGGTPAAAWFSILTLGPILGSFITEPAAMTICALLLAKTFYDFKPSLKLAYATIGLLFVNVSVGGTLTHFAAPPVLMVAARWDWGFAYMISHFGWKAILGIIVANITYFLAFRKSFAVLNQAASKSVEKADAEPPVPVWITVTHLLFLGWTVFFAHYPPFFIGGFLIFIGFMVLTEHEQDPLKLKSALLVGFFLAGLVIHGGLQQWWIAPVLGSLERVPLMIGATILTAFNDNAAITYLATLVPGFSDAAKYAVVAGAVTGGGLTVIANAPNPAGQSILNRYFPGGVNPLYLAASAIIPTIILGLCFMLIPPQA